MRGKRDEFIRIDIPGHLFAKIQRAAAQAFRDNLHGGMDQALGVVYFRGFQEAVLHFAPERVGVEVIREPHPAFGERVRLRLPEPSAWNGEAY